MPQCAVANCNNTHRKTKGRSVRYHRFPGDLKTRAFWLNACGRHVQNCATARVCSRHFSTGCYERDVQNELLGLPTRCRLKKGAAPDTNLPENVCHVHTKLKDVVLDEEKSTIYDSSIAILLAVGLVPNSKNGVLPYAVNKMHVMEDVTEGCDTQPSSPGHADQRTETAESPSSDECVSKTDKPDEEYTHLILEVPKEEISKNFEDSPKRKLSTDEPPPKKAKTDLRQEFNLRHKILSEYTEALDISNIDQIQTQIEQLISEIQNLSEIAKEKEREWNRVIHAKKLKEELLIRIQRQKQVHLLSNGVDLENETNEMNGDRNGQKRRQEPRPRSVLVKTLNNSFEINGLDPKKQRPVRDVQSIIADYRKKHPEDVPRRGRRIRGVNGQNMEVSSSKVTGGGVINFSNIALGSGSQVRQNTSNYDTNGDIGMLLSAMDNSNLDTQSSNESYDTSSVKDILVQFAKLSQSDKQELLQHTMKPPPPYPEVTVHPVSTTTPPTNSLLHGILTKSQNKTEKSTFSPTLARLLTAPERSVASQQQQQQQQLQQQQQIQVNNNINNNKGTHVISDILHTNKGRNEITITPVKNDLEGSPKRKSQTDEEEAEDSVDRLVIDEGGDMIDRNDNSSDTDEVPQCQGCNQKAAQFVCAGCGNQWYCSRECQVSAWDEHSEVCSG